MLLSVVSTRHYEGKINVVALVPFLRQHRYSRVNGSDPWQLVKVYGFPSGCHCWKSLSAFLVVMGVFRSIGIKQVNVSLVDAQEKFKSSDQRPKQ